jgi:hypothetical protein
LNIKYSIKIAISSMKMWRIMVIEVNRYENSKKTCLFLA